MRINNPEITPDEIKAIRQILGLTQVEAGDLLGGGPRAFTKYEAGTVTPAAAVINLLRLLEANPEMIMTLGGRKPLPTTAAETGPFEVTGDHIAALAERTLPLLLGRLLRAEAHDNSLPAGGIHVASDIYTADGGEDGRIEWAGGPDRTSFLPSRLCQFQLKAGRITPAKAARDALSKNGDVKPIVRSALENGGHYIMLCAHPFVQKQIVEREARIRKALRSAGVTIADDQVDFRDAGQIADWTNTYPSVATWVKERTQPGTLGPFRSWDHWAGRPEHYSSPWVEDERLPELRARSRNRVAEPHNIVRVVGLSGVGNTRLVLEALRPAEDEDAAGRSLSDFVLYAVESEVGTERVNEAVQSLADNGNRAIVVVDECAPETHRILSNMVMRQCSRLSLITIDHQIPTGTLDPTTIKVDEAPRSVTDAIINRVLPVLHHEDELRLVRFCKGFPKIAIRIGQTWGQSIPVAHTTDDDLVDAFVLGRSPRDRELLLKSAATVATFGLIYVKDSTDSQLIELANLGHSLNVADLRAVVEELAGRGVVQRRGKAVIFQPRPIAMKLAERQWREWGDATWDEVLAGAISPYFKVSAARQLAQLNTTETARDVVAHVCRIGGPFDGFEGISKTGHAEVLSALAEIDGDVVVRQIERSLDEVGDLSKIVKDVRRHLVWALEKIAFHSHTFEDGARLLLRLAIAENESVSNNATGQFKALFPMMLGNTAADGDKRLAVLNEAADTDDVVRLVIVVEALSAGSKLGHFSRIAGAEAQGSSPALESWRPATNDAAARYIEKCTTSLAKVATRDDKAGVTARVRLGQHLRSLVSNGFIDTVETVVQEVRAAVGEWSEALESLGDVIVHDGRGTDRDITDRVRTLIAEVKPRSLESQARFLVTKMLRDYPCGEELDFETRGKRQVEAVRALAAKLVKQPTRLAGVLPHLSCGDQRMASFFGQAVAESADTPLDWLDPIIAAVSDAPEDKRNFDLLSGFVAGIANDHPDVVQTLKLRASRSTEFAPALPRICQPGIPADLDLVIGALQVGLLPPCRLQMWVRDDTPPTAVARLIDAMLVHSAEAFTVAVELMGMYAHGAPDKLDGLRRQIRRSAEIATRWILPLGQPMVDHHFEQIMKWILDKGREDPDARAIALALARAVANVDTYNDARILEPVVPKLLSGFPEIVWPLIGHAILSDKTRLWHFEQLLGDQYSFDEKNPTILSLPEDTLFAWCHAHPDSAPAFVARVIPVLATHKVDASERLLHPTMARLLDEFGDTEGVLRAVTRNIRTFGWSGSRTTYYALYQQPLSALVNHRRVKVRRWARSVLADLRAEIREARNVDEEREALSEVR